MSVFDLNNDGVVDGLDAMIFNDMFEEDSDLDFGEDELDLDDDSDFDSEDDDF